MLVVEVHDVAVAAAAVVVQERPTVCVGDILVAHIATCPCCFAAPVAPIRLPGSGTWKPIRL